MTAPIVLSIIFSMFYIMYSYRNNRQSVKLATITALIVIWIGYFFIFLDKSSNAAKTVNVQYYLALIPILLFIGCKIYTLSKPKSLNILASQQNYWNIAPREIYNSYNHRLERKKDRVETKINKLIKRLTRQYSNEDKFYTTNLFTKIDELNLTKISNCKELENTYLYKIIFEKIKGFLGFREETVEFEQVLAENNYIAEYFLIDIWTRYTKPFNVGTANLNIYARKDIEKELVGALDNATLSSVKRHGAALYYKYAEFKGLIEIRQESEEIKELEDNENNEDENYFF